jgi:membrane associated rhomboid family serine protease
VAFASPGSVPDSPFTKPWRPEATYTLLGVMGAIWVIQLLFWGVKGPLVHDYFFVIDTDWYLRGWTLVTSTLAHSPQDPSHILFNGLFLFFFGPTVERILGQRRFLTMFFLTGAISGIAQVELAAHFGEGGGALGASGALMAIFGLSMVLLPNVHILVWGIVPVKLWIAGIGYAALDVLGAFNPYDGVGNFAHLTGMAVGLLYGVVVRRELRRRKMQLVYV